jgi:predicted enzyme related to lactoylglutathione lyase
VDDCDAAVARAGELGGVLRFGPMSSPVGRFAALSDPQGANFSVIDITTTEGEMPKIKDA